MKNKILVLAAAALCVAATASGAAAEDRLNPGMIDTCPIAALFEKAMTLSRVSIPNGEFQRFEIRNGAAGPAVLFAVEDPGDGKTNFIRLACDGKVVSRFSMDGDGKTSPSLPDWKALTVSPQNAFKSAFEAVAQEPVPPLWNEAGLVVTPEKGLKYSFFNVTDLTQKLVYIDGRTGARRICRIVQQNGRYSEQCAPESL